MELTKETIIKLGEALYKHAYLIKKAKEAEQAVEYLHSKKVV